MGRAREEAAGGKDQVPGRDARLLARFPGIMAAWYGSLTPAFLWLPLGKDLAYPGPVWASLSPAIALCQQAGQQAPQRSQNSFSPWGCVGKAAARVLLAPGMALPVLPAQGEDAGNPKSLLAAASALTQP